MLDRKFLVDFGKQRTTGLACRNCDYADTGTDIKKVEIIKRLAAQLSQKYACAGVRTKVMAVLEGHNPLARNQEALS